MESNNSTMKKVLIGTSIAIGIGLVVGLLCKKKKKNVSDGTQKRISEDDQSQDSKKSTSEPQKHPDVEILNFSTPSDLIEYALKKVLRAEKFRSSEEFLEEFIHLSTLLTDDYEWLNYFPRNSEELIETLKEYRLKNLFDIKLYKNIKA